MWNTSTGRLTYNPYRGDMKRRREWWCVLEVDPGITAYLRWFAAQDWWNVKPKRTDQRVGVNVEILKPAWDAHISMIRGEKPTKNADKWGQGHGKLIEFRWSTDIHRTTDWRFWYVDVDCPAINELRDLYGLPVRDHRGRDYEYHLTIGRTYEYDSKV